MQTEYFSSLGAAKVELSKGKILVSFGSHQGVDLTKAIMNMDRNDARYKKVINNSKYGATIESDGSNISIASVNFTIEELRILSEGNKLKGEDEKEEEKKLVIKQDNKENARKHQQQLPNNKNVVHDYVGVDVVRHDHASVRASLLDHPSFTKNMAYPELKGINFPIMNDMEMNSRIAKLPEKHRCYIILKWLMGNRDIQTTDNPKSVLLCDYTFMASGEVFFKDAVIN
jgi:hypothetical protein